MLIFHILKVIVKVSKNRRRANSENSRRDNFWRMPSKILLKIFLFYSFDSLG
jgi:hypothetical protein